MISKAALTAFAAVSLCSPAVAGEAQSYKVIVLEQIQHEVTVDADGENGAKTTALDEAKRTSGVKRGLESPAVLSHALQSNDFSVTVVKLYPELGAADLQSGP